MTRLSISLAEKPREGLREGVAQEGLREGVTQEDAHAHACTHALVSGLDQLVARADLPGVLADAVPVVDGLRRWGALALWRDVQLPRCQLAVELLEFVPYALHIGVKQPHLTSGRGRQCDLGEHGGVSITMPRTLHAACMRSKSRLPFA